MHIYVTVHFNAQGYYSADRIYNKHLHVFIDMTFEHVNML